MMRNVRHHSLYRVMTLLVILSLFLPPQAVLAAPEAAPVQAPAQQSAGQGVIVGEVYHDATGLPLAGATITLLSVDGTAVSGPAVISDARGRYRLASAAGAARLRVTRPGYTTVERTATVTADRSAAAFDARLALLDPSGITVPSVVGGTVASADGSITLRVPAGALNGDTAIALTWLSAQGLAGLPPRGWSPVAAADVSPQPLAFGSPATLRMNLPADLPASTTAIAARWDVESGQWIALGQSNLTPAQTQIEVEISASGQFAVFLPDPAPNAPALPAAGQPLAGVTPAAAPADLTAEILPSSQVIFTASDARAPITVRTQGSTALTSGEPLQLTLNESYAFNDGSSLHPEPMVQDILVFAYPGTPTTPAANLMVAPSHVAEPHELRQGVIDIAVTLADMSGGPLALTNGLKLTGSNGEELSIPRRAADQQPVRFSGLPAAGFPLTLPSGMTFVHGFSVDLFGGRLGLPAALSAPIPASLPASAQVLAVRLVVVDGVSRLELTGPVSRSGGRLRFNGLTAEGRYAFISTATALGFVSGMVTGASGTALQGVLVSVPGQPFISITNPEGRYIVAGQPGTVEVNALDPQSYDAASKQAVISAAGSFTTLNLTLAALPPSVVGSAPVDQAVDVPLAGTVTITFSEPVAPLSTVNALVLSTASGPVNGAGTLSPDGLVLTYRPNALLASQTTYTATLAASVTDRSGNPMLAPYVITFRTVDVTPPPRPEPGQIQATIPNENGISFVTGSPGTAEPGQPVRVRVVRNSADTTVLANDDGSFQLEVQALLSDKLVLFIHDGAGNITEVAVPRFENPDGSVVVGSEGGIVSAPDGSYAEVEPGSLPDGTVVKVTPITEVELPAAAPVEFPFLAGVRLDLGPITPTHYIDLAVPAPPDARVVDIVLVTQPITLPNGTVAWKLIDRAHLENGKYVTASPPFPGALASATYSFFRPAYIIEPGPDGILQTEPRFASDDEVEQRPHPDGGTYEVIVGGSDGKLQTSPRESSDDVRRTECMSFVSMSSSFKLEVQIFTPMVPPFIVPSSGIDQVTLVGYCNQPLEVQVVDSGTGELLEAISVTAPAARNEILYPGNGLTDDHEAPFVVGTILPTNMIEQSPEVYLKFNEAMLAETLVNNFKVRDSRGYAVAGAVDVLFRNTVAVFRPRVAFRLDEEFTIDLTGVTDFAGNPVQSAPLKFKRTAPHSLGEFRDSPEIFDALAVCADQNDPDSCAISPRDVATLGNTAFLANGLGWPYQYYKDQVNQRRIAVLDTSNPTAPKIIGWYRTVTVPRSVAVLPDVAFNYISVDGSNARFEGDLLIVTGGGIGGNTSARLEIYDVTACFQRTPGVTNCLDESLQPFKGAKFMSTGLNNTQYQGVPPDPGSAAELEILHQRVIKQSDEAGPQRQDTVIAYSVIVPVGIVAVDITKAFNAGSTKPDRYAIDGLYRGDFYDLSVVKNLVVAGENPSSGSPKMRVFDVSLVPLEEVPVPRAFRVATGENFIVDLDNDGNLGAGEDNDNDTITGRDELFDLAFVTSGGRATTWGRGDLYVLDLSKRTDLQHPEPLRDADNLSEDPRIISRIPLPGPAFDVCIDMLSQLAYVALDGVGLAVVDLSHLTGVIRDGQSGRWLIDDNGDFVDDRVLYIFRHETQPVQYLLGFDCRDPNLAEDPNANQRPAYAPAQPGTLVLNWEQTGSQILGNFAVIAESPVVIKSDYDLVNQAVCEPLEYLEFFLSHPATVTVTIDGAVIKVDEDFVEPENDQVDEGLIDFANIRLAAGAHRYPIPVDAVTDMGDHPFQVKAVFMPGDPGVVMTADGIVRHELSMKANLPIGHTMVKNVDLWDGHLVHSSQDIRIPGRGPSLEFNRTYSSGGVEFSGLLGAGWSHNLNVRLVYDNCGKYVVIGGEGSGNAFTNPQRDDAKRQLYSRPGFVLDENVEFFQPQIGYHSTLVRDPDDLNKFDFFTKSFVRYHFEREGMLPGEVYTLRFIEDANGNRLTFDYVSGDQDPTTLDNVTDDAGRKLRFHYALVADSMRIVKVEGIVSPDPNLPSAAPNIEMLYG
ncbi:MAG: Ig-like domain-containing protein, partial [Caldilineaceae bacterium]|nr:Ig-like domain-containing protein [Caldilineaceae bacterium]